MPFFIHIHQKLQSKPLYILLSPRMITNLESCNSYKISLSSFELFGMHVLPLNSNISPWMLKAFLPIFSQFLSSSQDSLYAYVMLHSINPIHSTFCLSGTIMVAKCSVNLSVFVTSLQTCLSIYYTSIRTFELMHHSFTVSFPP